MGKKIFIGILIILITIPLIVVIYPVRENNKYEENLLNNIYNNTDIEKITYLNKDNNYYIVKSEDKVIVLDLNYEEKYSLDINKLQDSSFELTYRRNNLYYKEEVKEDNKLIYKFYNALTNELEYETVIGGN